MENIKILRERTGAGVIDCQQALAEAGGDLDKAVEILRKKGIAKAASRGDRQAKEGLIKLAVTNDNQAGFMVELKAETDFVVRSQKFQDFADQVLQLIKEKKPTNRDELMALPLGQATVSEDLNNLSGVIGEKLDITRCGSIFSDGTVAGYSHLGGKIGVLVAINKAGENELATNLAMQIAAANPKYIRPEDVPADEITKEKEIYQAQLTQEGKPANVADKIIAGKLSKYFQEICLLEQEYIKDDKKRVKDILGGVEVERFIRYSL